MKEKQFIDEAWINIESGPGGSGLATFHKEKGLNRGGPSGGNGGDGGSIIFLGESGENTLLDFKTSKVFKAEKGIAGGANNRTGANGKDLYIKVPLGTQFYDENNQYLFEILNHNDQFTAAIGGKGGRGNSSFKSSKSPSPKLYEAGELGHRKHLRLNLKVLADVGLLGFPNAGKSTFISIVSNAKPKIADYEFTTLVPKLGIVKHNEYKFVVSDLPGLIEGANEDKGMGIQFLKHLERTQIILHLIDASEENDIVSKYKILRKELSGYSKDLAKKKEIIVLTKLDILSKDELKKLEPKIEKLKKINSDVFIISSLTKENLNLLLDKLVEIIRVEKSKIVITNENVIFKYVKSENNDDLEYHITQTSDREWTISGKYIEYWGNRIPLANEENWWRLYNKMRSKGIMDALVEKGIKEGDYIKIKNTSFEMQYYDEDEIN